MLAQDMFNLRQRGNGRCMQWTLEVGRGANGVDAMAGCKMMMIMDLSRGSVLEPYNL
jgi:hypothetical protein